MADKKIRLKQQKQDGTYDYLFPATKSSIVDVNGKTLDVVLAETDEKIVENEGKITENFTEQLTQTATKKIEHISKGKQYVIADLTTSKHIIKIQYKYSPSEDRWLVLERCGLNELFSYSAIYKNTSGGDRVKPTGDFSTATLVQQFDTDIIGPLQVRSDANATGDNPNNTAFTGGWHGFNGDQTGAPTARHESIDVYADGLQLNGSKFEGYVDELYIKTKSKIQGYNTRKVDGTGREILTQELNILVKEGKSEIHCRLITLESCTFVQYYGLQVPLSGGNSSTGATVHYVNGDSTVRKPFTPNTSGVFATYPCDRVMLKTATNDDIAIWIDNSYGLGTRTHISETKASAFIAGYKAYFYLISEAPFSLGAGTPLEWHGGIAWEKSPTGLTAADSYIKLLQNGNVWRVMDFLKAGTEFETPDTDEMFITANGVKELKKSSNIIGFLTNYFYSYSIGSNGYGDYWFNFKKE